MQHVSRLRRAAPVALVLLLGSGLAGFASADPLSKVEPPKCAVEQPTEYFCCGSVNPWGNNGAGSGEGCVKIAGDQVNDCSKWLACPGGATSDEGTVACTAPKKD